MTDTPFEAPYPFVIRSHETIYVVLCPHSYVSGHVGAHSVKWSPVYHVASNFLAPQPLWIRSGWKPMPWEDLCRLS